MEEKLPDVRIQDTFYEVLKDISNGKVKKEEVWTEFGSKEVRHIVDAEGINTETAGYRASVSDAAKALELHSPRTGMTLVRFGDPIRSLKDQQRVTCGTVFGSKLLIGNDSGNLKLMHMKNPELDMELGGHLLHTSVAQFFPSGQVALSAGMDYTIKLWDLQSGREIQSLRHQRGLVEDVALISRGRNLLSLCPTDLNAGIVLWEVGTPQVIHEYAVPNPQCIGLWPHGSKPEGPDVDPFYGVDGNVGLVGTDKEMRILDIRQPNTTKLLDNGASSFSVNNDRLVYANNEMVAGLDLRMPNKRQFTLFSPAPVSQVLSTSSKAYIKTESQTYGFTYRSSDVEVLCCSNKGVFTSYNDELWSLGIEARHFPL